LSEIMLQQTTVKTVVPYFVRFTARWPTVQALASAPLEDVLKLWAGLGYYARARHLHACARAVIERHRGHFPATEPELAALPGVGAYTAAAIAAIAFDASTAAVDGNVERVVARLFAFTEELPAAKIRLRRLAQVLVPHERAGDFAQALMDLGATVCTPKNPACAVCPWIAACAACRRGDPHAFPVKALRREGLLRRGAAFVVIRAGSCLLVRSRPLTGLLGGMTEVPVTDWTPEFDDRQVLSLAPALKRAKPNWRRVSGVVDHAFTHFPLQLVVYRASVGASAAAPSGMRWVRLAALAEEALPSLMRKVVIHALPGSPWVGVMKRQRQPRRRAR
jgi:A/G-specific adenine glycosylase